ncbi:MAG: TIR domain-containing protein [Sphingobacteriales bacterium]|nr:MAG: TIR domain-containing protein [Sphingobacteriales bacterium]
MDRKTALIDVFISFKSADIELAEELFHFLESRGLVVFLSSESLPQLGSADYRKAIDHALDQCRHMIVIGSKLEYFSSSWVEAEWGFYINEKRAGRKSGNILTVVTNDISIEDLPASLRYFQVIFFEKENFDQIASYVGKDYQDPAYKPKRKSILKSKWFLPAISLLALLVVLLFVLNENRKPFDAGITVIPDQLSNINPNYPAFEGGDLSLYIGDKVERQKVIPNQAAHFQQLPFSFDKKKIRAALEAKNWKLLNDSFIVVKGGAQLSIVPDGKLGTVYGNVRDANGNPVDNCLIKIDTDTLTSTNSSGDFRIVLPYSMQKQQYMLFISKDKFQSQKLDYFGGAGSIDIRLAK